MFLLCFRDSNSLFPSFLHLWWQTETNCGDKKNKVALGRKRQHRYINIYINICNSCQELCSTCVKKHKHHPQWLLSPILQAHPLHCNLAKRCPQARHGKGLWIFPPGKRRTMRGNQGYQRAQAAHSGISSHFTLPAFIPYKFILPYRQHFKENGGEKFFSLPILCPEGQNQHIPANRLGQVLNNWGMCFLP